MMPDYAEDAVSWWFVRVFYDGFAYARGGRVRSARLARKTIKEAWDASLAEHSAYKHRFTHRLGKDGELIPIELAESPSLKLARFYGE